MINRPNTKAQRLKRHKRVRGRVFGTPEMPRLNVFRSEKHIYAQIIDDTKGTTLCSASSVEKDFEGVGSNKEAAKKVGMTVAQRAKEKAEKTLQEKTGEVELRTAELKLKRALTRIKVAK